MQDLKKSEIIFNEEKGTFNKEGYKLDILRSGESKKAFIPSKFAEIFYNKLKEEINKSYDSEIYTGTFMLCRKLIENSVIDILRLKFPATSLENLSLYYNTKKGRFNDMTCLLENLEGKKEDFGADVHIIEEFISLVKLFKI